MNNTLAGVGVILLGIVLMWAVITGKIDRLSAAWNVLKSDESASPTAAKPAGLAVPTLPLLSLPSLQRIS